jgi:hypothetical protein
MKLRRFILSMLLNERQREVIWQALQFSAHTYKRRNNPEGAAVVYQVMTEIEPKMFAEKKSWSKKEVEQLIEKSSELLSEKVDAIAKEAYAKGVRHGRSEAVKQRTWEDMTGEAEKYVGHLRPFPSGVILPGMTFNKETCESCDNKEDCGIYQTVLKAEFEENEEEAAEETKGTEQADKAPSEADNNEHQPVEGEETK